MIHSTTLHGAILTTRGTTGTGQYATTPSTMIGTGVVTTTHSTTHTTTIITTQDITLRHPHQRTVQVMVPSLIMVVAQEVQAT